MRAPAGQRGRRVDAVVQHVDVVPTVLEAAGADVPAHVEGVSLWATVRDGGEPPADRLAHSYLDYEGRRGIAVQDGRWKLIEPLSRNFTPGRELYDREDDPGELHDLSERLEVRAGLLASAAAGEMARHGTGLPEGEGPEFSGATREALEALGYIR
jgi:arylsulfatase A-like enzyme